MFHKAVFLIVIGLLSHLLSMVYGEEASLFQKLLLDMILLDRSNKL